VPLHDPSNLVQWRRVRNQSEAHRKYWFETGPLAARLRILCPQTHTSTPVPAAAPAL
jgi:hypothetical protein